MTSRLDRSVHGGGAVSRTRVGKYELGRTLGEGNFAKVKFAKHVDTLEQVAIKILDKEKILKHKMIGQVNYIYVIVFFLGVKFDLSLSPFGWFRNQTSNSWRS